MKNKIETFTLFIRNDSKSHDIAKNIRELNKSSDRPLNESKNGDLIIAIGGDGTFIDAVTSTNFCKDKIYAGIHTGTLGFLQNLSAEEVYTLMKYVRYEQEIMTRKIILPTIEVELANGKIKRYNALNEIIIGGKNYSKISFSEYVNGELLQRVSANAICIASNTGDTAFSMNAGGSIDFSNHCQLVRTFDAPIQNAAYERFVGSPAICAEFHIILEPSNDIIIVIDGRQRKISSNEIASVKVSMLDASNYINKFEVETYSKARVIRKKILGYDD